MARIEWVLLCDLAYLDRYGRVCTVGITTSLIVPPVPVHLREIMMVARVVDQRPGHDIDISVAVRTPSGLFATPSSSDNLHIEVASEYVLVTLRDLPPQVEGLYAFHVSLRSGSQAALALPTFAIPREQHAGVH